MPLSRRRHFQFSYADLPISLLPSRPSVFFAPFYSRIFLFAFHPLVFFRQPDTTQNWIMLEYVLSIEYLFSRPLPVSLNSKRVSHSDSFKAAPLPFLSVSSWFLHRRIVLGYVYVFRAACVSFVRKNDVVTLLYKDYETQKLLLYRFDSKFCVEFYNILSKRRADVKVTQFVPWSSSSGPRVLELSEAGQY